MENASKALIMAGSILIAIIIISLLVMAYSNLTKTMNAKNDEQTIEQVIEFNKQYDVYYRDNLYGSDILSLANKVADYNERQAKEQAYAKLDIEVTFSKEIEAGNNGKIIEKNEKYNSTKIKNVVEKLEENVEKYKNINSKENEKVKELGKTIASLSGLRTKELEQLLQDNKIYSRKDEIQQSISKYLGYNTALTTLKSKTFKATKFEYDDVTKRITKMIFQENCN